MVVLIFLLESSLSFSPYLQCIITFLSAEIVDQSVKFQIQDRRILLNNFVQNS